MEIAYGKMKDYRVTYSVLGETFTSVVQGMDSIDAKRRFERRLGFAVLKIDCLSVETKDA